MLAGMLVKKKVTIVTNKKHYVSRSLRSDILLHCWEWPEKPRLPFPTHVVARN